MEITQFLALFHPVKETKKGWDVCCPAHDDQHPSLGVMEGENGRIVLSCLAACDTKQICAALGLTLADLFADRPVAGTPQPVKLPPIRVTPRKRAFAYELHALDLRQAADKILSKAKDCEECDTWTNADRELAMKAVARAYAYQERAHFCENYADHLREQDYELKRLALG
jgi:hypothetical protein